MKVLMFGWEYPPHVYGIKFKRDPYNSISAENPYAALTAVKNDMMGHMLNGHAPLRCTTDRRYGPAPWQNRRNAYR